MTLALRRLAMASALALAATSADAAIIAANLGTEAIISFANANGDTISFDSGDTSLSGGDSFALPAAVITFINNAGGAANVTFGIIGGNTTTRTYLTSSGSAVFADGPDNGGVQIANAVRKAAPGVVLIVAPRHPERGPEIAAMLGGALRSQGEAMAPVYVADTLGEMGLFFRLADIVVMGGSFVPGIGGHNPLEPARIGRPILTGRYAFNAADVYADMFAEVAAIEAADGAALARHIQGLLDNPAIARRMSEAALAYAGRQGAALDQALALLDPLLAP